jgi:hypothetical protein
MQEEGRLGGFRAYIRKLWNTVDGSLDPGKIDMPAREFKDELTGEYAKAQAEWSQIDSDLMKWAIPAIGGAVTAAGAMVTGHYTLALPGAGSGLMESMNSFKPISSGRHFARKRLSPFSLILTRNDLLS